MQPLKLQVTEIGDREFYPSFSEKEKKNQTEPGPDRRLHVTETLLFCMYGGLKHCRGGEGFHVGLSSVVPF